MSSPTESPPSQNTSSWGSPPPPPSNSSLPPPPDSSSSPPWSDSNQTSPPPPSENVTNQSPPPPANNNESSPPPSSSNSFPTPPPPSRSQLPPAAKHKSNSSPSSHRSSSEKTLSDDQKATIAGVAAGAGLLFLILIAFLISCCCRRKKRKSRAQIHYYPNGNYYQGRGDNNGNWHNNAAVHSGEHMVKIPPPPAGPPSGAVSSEYGWPMGPPPPPPMMSSGEMNSAAYSGQHPQAMAPPRPSIGGFNQSSFTYNDLAAATGGFSQANLLGQGGFGYVHKGVLPNGKEVAVKSLKSNSGQGEREFQAEVEIISRVHHRHLVSLVGYCIAGPQRMLVYEFVPNGTLEYHLHGSGRPVMDFQTRLKIALGSAKGFAYLHEDCHPRIIHRDIKAANILLDYNFEAMVADFGLAKLSSDNNTHVSTRIMGTFGYLAPEYASSGKLTEKSDVYSYGVMLLELITGRRPVDLSNDDEDSLVDWARPILMRAAEGGSYEELVDPRLENNYDPQEMSRMVACAGASIRHSARRRPKMSQIVRALEGDVSLDDLNSAAAVKSENSSATTFGSGGSSEYDGNPYDMKKFRKSVLSSQEFSSGEHGMTDEFVHPRI